MSQATADILGSVGATFTVTISAATILKADLEVPDKADQSLFLVGPREVAIPQLPKGDSVVRLALVWAPGEHDAVIDIGSVSFGTATAPAPKDSIDRGNNPGFVLLFGLDGPC